MHCPFCNHPDTQVKDSRPHEEGKIIRRRRECLKCKKRYTTSERFELQHLTVIKSDGSRQLFDRDKLIRSIMIPMQKRFVAKNDLDKLASEIESHVMLASQGDEIESKEIGQIILQLLKEVDFVGYVRYASIYNDFSSLQDFERLVRNLKK